MKVKVHGKVMKFRGQKDLYRRGMDFKDFLWDLIDEKIPPCEIEVVAIKEKGGDKK